MSSFNFFTKPQYFADFIRQVKRTKSGDRVILTSLRFDVGEPIVQKVLEALTVAAQRQVDVLLMIDAYSFLVYGHTKPGPLFYGKKLSGKLPHPFNERLDALEKLKDAGGRYLITNWPSGRLKFPFAGRDHIKFAVVNDYCYVGGCNLSDISQTDLMVGWTDPKTADWLADFADKITQADGQVLKATDGRDIRLKIDNQTDLLVDAGRRDQSVIFDTALGLIDQAKERVVITCQYFPNNVTASQLKKTFQRGVDVKIYFSHPSSHAVPQNIPQYMVAWFERLRNPSDFFKNRLKRGEARLHAKLIVVDDTTLVGSHNFVPGGVKWGTAEIALLSRDPAFTKQALKTIESQL